MVLFAESGDETTRYISDGHTVVRAQHCSWDCMKRAAGPWQEPPAEVKQMQSITSSNILPKTTPEMISKDVNSKISWGGMPPDPPRQHT